MIIGRWFCEIDEADEDAYYEDDDSYEPTVERLYVDHKVSHGRDLYLGRKDAAALWPILKCFAETGRLPEQDEAKP